MARTYEQPPVAQKKSNEAMCQIYIQKTGDDGVDATAVALYEGLGYKFATQSKTGTITMETTKSRAEEISQEGIQRHYAYANGAKKAPDIEGAKVVQNDTIRSTQPMTADQLAAEMGEASSPMDMDDDL